jgi:hypothetical protein
VGPKATTTNFKFGLASHFCLPHTQYAAKKQKNHRNEGSIDKKFFFGLVPKLHIQMGSLSVQNASEKFSRLGTFKASI